MGGNGRLARGDTAGLSGQLVRGTAWGLGSRIARVVVTVAGIAILARLLTPADFGIYALSSLSITFAFNACEGLLDFPIVRFDDITRNVVRNLMWLTILGLTLLSSVLVFFGDVLGEVVDTPHLQTALLLTAPAVVLQVHTVASLAILRRDLKFRTAALSTLVAPVSFVMVAVPAALISPGVVSLVGAQTASVALNAVVLARISRLPLLPPRKLELGGVMGSAISGSGSRSLAWATSNIDTVAVAVALGPAATGLYSRAYSMNVQLKEPFTVLETMTRQALASMRAKGELRPSLTRRAFRLLTLVGALIAGSVVIASDGLVQILLGSQWRPAGALLAILAVALPARVALNFLNGLTIAASGSMNSMLWRTVVGLLVTIIGLATVTDRGLTWASGAVSLGVYAGLVTPDVDKSQFALGVVERIRLMCPALLLLLATASVALVAHERIENAWALIVAGAVAFAGTGLIALIFLPSDWLAFNAKPPPRGLKRINWLAAQRRKAVT